jgi:hypothetical protein
MEHVHHREGDGEFKPFDICNMTFLSMTNAVKCAWTAGTVIVVLIGAALSWAAWTNHSITVLETKTISTESTVISNQNLILQKLDAIAVKADNTRVGK